MSEEKTLTQAEGHPSLAQLPAKREVRVVHDVIPLLDTDRFEHMYRVANVMASMTLIPDGLKAASEKQTAANCFLVVNFASGNEMDPFQVAQMVSVIHGKLCYEGKLIHAVIEKKLGIRLSYDLSGEGENRKVVVSGKFEDEDQPRTISGTVADWKVVNRKKDGGETSAWTPKSYDRMLRYRGAREWCRAFAPGVILGVYSRDEMYEEEFNDDEPPSAPKNIPIEEHRGGNSGRPIVGGPDDPRPDQAANRPTDEGIPDLPEFLDRRAEKAQPAVPKIDTSKKADAEEAEVVEDVKRDTPIPGWGEDDEPPSAPVEEPAEEPIKAPTADSVLDAVEVDLRTCKTPADVKKVQKAYEAAVAKMLPPDQQEFQNMVAQALERTAKK